MNILSTLKLHAGISAAVIALATMSNACSAQAGAARLKVVVPFGFENGSQHLEAGTYTVKVAGTLLNLSGDKDSSNALALPDTDMSQSTNSKVIFRKYGDKYFLREVWVAGSMTHMHLPVTKAEKRVQIAQNVSATKGPEVALLDLNR